MLFQPKRDGQFGRLCEQLERAEAVTPELASGLAETCTRIAALDRVQARTRVDRLIASEAWTDAALALVELELPQWKLRRLLYEDGEWHCCAILSAFVKARQIAATVRDASRTVPLVPPERYRAICCDNFA